MCSQIESALQVINYIHIFTLTLVYSIPNIFLPFFGGYIADRFGADITYLVTLVFITIGQLLFAVGLASKNWSLMLASRAIYGIGGESMGVANSALLAEWFQGRELAFAFGINLSVARLGSVMNNLLSPSLSNSNGVVFANWFGVILGAIA